MRHLFFFKMKSLMPWIMQTAVTLHIYVTMTWYPICFPAVYPIYLTPRIPMPVCFCLVTFPVHSSLVFFHAYIRLINHVCFCSLYIDFYCQSPTCVWPKSHTSWYFQPPETIWLSNLCSFDFAQARKLFPQHPSTLWLPYGPLGAHIPVEI